MRLRRSATAIVGAAALLGAAGCASGSNDRTGEIRGPASTSFSASESSPTGGLTTATFGGTIAAAMRQAGSVHIVMRSPGLGTVFTGDVSGLGREPQDVRVDARMVVPEGIMAKMLLVDSVVYYQVPGGGGWIAEPADDSSAPTGSTDDGWASAFDPNESLRLDSALTTLTEVGPERVDGVTTERYRLVIDTAKLLRASGAHGAGGISLKEVLQAMPKHRTFDIWLDSKHQVIKLVSDSGDETHYSDWGKRTHIVAPPSSQVIGLPQ